MVASIIVIDSLSSCHVLMKPLLSGQYLDLWFLYEVPQFYSEVSKSRIFFFFFKLWFGLSELWCWFSPILCSWPVVLVFSYFLMVQLSNYYILSILIFLKRTYSYLHLHFACMYECAKCVCLVPTELEEAVGSLGTGVKDGCELPCVSWKPNLGPL